MAEMVFIDTSALKALLDEKDDFHLQSNAIINRLVDEKVRFITSNFIVDECATVLRYKGNKKLALMLQDFIFNSQEKIEILRTRIDDEANAWVWFKKDWSKLSFTDCVSFSQLKRLGINRVFGFDHHFEQAGFILEK